MINITAIKFLSPAKLMLPYILIVYFAFCPYVHCDDKDSESPHLNVPLKNFGLSMGNSRGINGIRINLRDDGLQYVNGVNFTLWIPKDNDDAEINGWAVGLIAPDAGEINGISLGGIGVEGGDLTGIVVGTIGVSAESVSGITFGGIGLASGRIRGIALGGIGLATQRLRGIGIGGIGIACEELNGFAAGSIGAAVENANGIVVGGIGVASEEINGFGFGLIGVATEKLRGGAFGGIGIAAESVRGICLGGVGVVTEESTGASVAVGEIRSNDLVGFGMAGYCRIKGSQRGLTIALLNHADELHGFQLGAINIARNNSGIFKVLPLINYHR